MCVKLLLGDLNSDPYPPHSTSTYTCGVIIAPKVCGGGKQQLNKKREIILFYFKRREKLFKCQFLILYLRFCLPLHVYFGNFDFCICVVGDFFFLNKKKTRFYATDVL